VGRRDRPLQEAMELDSENSQCYSHLMNVLLKARSEEFLIACYRPELEFLEFEEAEVYYGWKPWRKPVSLRTRFPVIVGLCFWLKQGWFRLGKDGTVFLRIGNLTKSIKE